MTVWGHSRKHRPICHPHAGGGPTYRNLAQNVVGGALELLVQSDGRGFSCKRAVRSLLDHLPAGVHLEAHLFGRGAAGDIARVERAFQC